MLIQLFRHNSIVPFARSVAAGRKAMLGVEVIDKFLATPEADLPASRDPAAACKLAEGPLADLLTLEDHQAGLAMAALLVTSAAGMPLLRHMALLQALHRDHMVWTDETTLALVETFPQRHCNPVDPHTVAVLETSYPLGAPDHIRGALARFIDGLAPAPQGLARRDKHALRRLELLAGRDPNANRLICDQNALVAHFLEAQAAVVRALGPGMRDGVERAAAGLRPADAADRGHLVLHQLRLARLTTHPGYALATSVDRHPDAAWLHDLRLPAALRDGGLLHGDMTFDEAEAKEVLVLAATLRRDTSGFSLASAPQTFFTALARPLRQPDADLARLLQDAAPRLCSLRAVLDKLDPASATAKLDPSQPQRAITRARKALDQALARQPGLWLGVPTLVTTGPWAALNHQLFPYAQTIATYVQAVSAGARTGLDVTSHRDDLIALLLKGQSNLELLKSGKIFRRRLKDLPAELPGLGRLPGWPQASSGTSAGHRLSLIVAVEEAGLNHLQAALDRLRPQPMEHRVRRGAQASLKGNDPQ